MRHGKYLWLLAALLAAACDGAPRSSAAADPRDPYAGLSDVIRLWRADLARTRSDCADKAHPCRNFEVACKGERGLSAPDASAGVRARVVTAMTFEGWDALRGEYRSAPVFALFTRTAQGWSRADSTPVTLSDCSAMPAVAS